MSEIQCYNKGCGQKFDPSNNKDDSCLFHPGPPFFHDAQKIWKCCDKKSTDFGTWLSFKGCTKGKHNSEKPADTVRLSAQKEIRPEKEDEVIVWNGLNKPAERPQVAEEERSMQALVFEVAEGLREAIRKFRDEAAAAALNELSIGAPCVNNGCKEVYNGPEWLDSVKCVYHPGAAVFHEGMKYWSCCQRKTSNFSAFLDQAGCETGKHSFVKNEKVDKIREDWFARSGHIHVNVYCKGAIPESCLFETDGLVLKVKVVHGFGTKESVLSYELFGRILPQESRVLVGERKVEIVLKQAENQSWPQLVYIPPKQDDVVVDETAETVEN